ncbi:hypothetical protein MtrunA17_Chr7g0265271 [Medicago truncatula]|uniref:Transmembrane protein n=1 Tax=Medicago truncatula TaxID=3880 RepID=A0A396H5M6_MEDTR|nr:hypothetical protein MtrunA17_Chr7g0265271 [Medicago truncatula]
MQKFDFFLVFSNYTVVVMVLYSKSCLAIIQFSFSYSNYTVVVIVLYSRIMPMK